MAHEQCCHCINRSGNANNYVYVLDPINGSDYSGMCAYLIQCTIDISIIQPAAPTAYYQPTVSSASVQSSREMSITVHVNAPAYHGAVKFAAIAPMSGSKGNSVKNVMIDIVAVVPYGVYYGARAVRHAVVSIPGGKYTPLNLSLLAVEGAGLGGDAGLDWLKRENIGDEGKRGCTQPLHSYVGPCGPYVYLPGIHEDGKMDW